LKKSAVACVVWLSLSAFGTAGAADLPVKAPPKPPPAPTWWVSGGALLWTVKSTSLPPT
jgi:Putative beta barrel porin-7 (BBP7)